ncbi:MAG: benzoate/H(+) symporter BenE family transporter [Dehalococcoidia bacterium]
MSVIAIAAQSRPFAAFANIRSQQITASLTATLFYVFGPVPLYFAAARGFGGDDVAISGFVAVFASAGFATALLSMLYRKPIALGWSLPGLLFLAAASRTYALDEVMGASLIASLAILVCSMAGAIERIERAIPPHVAMAVLAGSVLSLCIAPFNALGSSPEIVLPTIAGFFVARRLNSGWFPPAAGAVAIGLPAALIFGPHPHFAAPESVASMTVVWPAFSLEAITALVPPLVVFILIGNNQGRTVLAANGYESPGNSIGMTTGVMGAVHALFGAPPASMQRVAQAVLTGDEAGKHADRWMAAVFAAIGCLLIALLAAPLEAFTGSLHPAFVSTLIGLLLMKVIGDALRRTTEGQSMAGPIAFCIAASSASLGGLTPEFWAMAGGCAIVLFERERKTA